VAAFAAVSEALWGAAGSVDTRLTNLTIRLD